MSTVRGLEIATAGQTPLTPDQQRFNTLLRQIERVRNTLAAWHENTALFEQAHAQLIAPLLQEYSTARREHTFALDRLTGEPGWTKAEQRLLRELVCESAADLLEEQSSGDAELEALFDKHSEVDYQTGLREARLVMKEMAEAVTGLDLGDGESITSEDDLFRRIHEGLAGENAKAEAAKAAKAEAAGRRRKSAAQQRREAEAQLASQSIREVFRKLASALHPDRESDPARQVEKTALMQKVNQAYAANDLLGLLELQLEIEQVDAGHIANAPAQRVKHYNKVLAGQLADLKAETERVEGEFRLRFSLEGVGAVNASQLGRTLERRAREVQALLAALRNERGVFGDRVATKRWLKREKQRLRETAHDNPFF